MAITKSLKFRDCSYVTILALIQDGWTLVKFIPPFAGPSWIIINWIKSDCKGQVVRSYDLYAFSDPCDAVLFSLKWL